MQVIVAALALITVVGPAVAVDDPLCKTIGSEWQWFGDHAALEIEYQVSGAAGRLWEVGTGISFRDKPLGSRSKHMGHYLVKAYDLGAIHIRAADGGEPFQCA